MQNSFNPVQQLLSLHARGQFTEMEQQARQLLRGNANAPILNELLGIALTGQRKFPEALPFLLKAVRREPNDALFWENLGRCQRELGEFAHAEKSLRQSLKLRPDNVEALNMLSSVLGSLERFADAEEILRRVIRLMPGHAGAHFNLGALLLKNGRLSEAEFCFRRVLELDPGEFITYAHLADICLKTSRADVADELIVKAFEQLGDIRAHLTPDRIARIDRFAGLLHNMQFFAEALRIRRFTVDYDDTNNRASLAVLAARNICDWDFAAELEGKALRLSGTYPDQLGAYFSLALAGASPQRQLEIAKEYWRQRQSPDVVKPLAKPRLDASRDRIRVGYLSSDFGDHATSILLAGTIEAHDRKRFDVIAYDHSTATDDAYRLRMKRAFERFEPVLELGPKKAMQQIAADEVDILVDLKGWTLGTWSEFMMSRPAPVQIQWLGYPGTLGASWIDYIVADRTLIEPGEEAFYSEKVIRLPDCYQPNDDRRKVPSPVSRQAAGLPENALVFGCFNQAFKITPDVFGTWMRLLRAVDGAVLWLLDAGKVANNALRAAAAAQGIAADRIIFAEKLAQDSHLNRITQTDVALDCFPYTSHTTASDMLWAGVPLVGLSGSTIASRVSKSILRAANLGDLATESLDDYFALALRLAGDDQYRTEVKARVRAVPHSALFDTKRFTRHLEHALELIWERHVAGLTPDHVDVPGQPAQMN